MTAFYEKAKDTFGQNNTDKVKLYDKMRTMRSRFWKITSKLEEGNISENEFVFKSPHEAAMFKIWRQIWGSVEKHQNDENPLPSQNDGNPLPSQNDGNRFINTIHPVNPEIDLCSRRIKELIEAVRSVKEFPGLGVAEAQLLQQKWRKHRMEELKLFSNSLALLQEECTLSLRELQHGNPSRT